MAGMKSDNYFVITGVMCNEMGLSGNELMIYAIIRGFSQDGESRYTGGRSFLAETLNITKPTVDKALASLIDKEYIIKIEVDKYEYQFYEYQANLDMEKKLQCSKETLPGGSKEILPPSKNSLPGVVKKLYGGSKETLLGGSKKTLPNNININNIDNNIENNKGVKKDRYIRNCIGMLKTAYPYWKGDRDATLLLWSDVFSDTDPVVLTSAVQMHIKQSKFFPTITEIQKLLPYASTSKQPAADKKPEVESNDGIEMFEELMTS